MRRWFLMMCTVAFTLMAAIQAYAYKSGDWQYNNTEGISASLNDRWKIYAETEFRFGDHAHEFFYQHTYAELKYQVNDWFEMGPGFREAFELCPATETKDKHWINEHCPLFNATVKWKWGSWNFSNRNRVEYRMYDDTLKEDIWRYRNCLMVKSPWKWTRFEINPFIGDEIYMKEHYRGVYGNAVAVGVSFRVIKNLKGELYYMWQRDDKGIEIVHTNIIVSKLKLEF